MKKVVNRTLKWLLVFFVCFTTFNLSIFAKETMEGESQEVLETQESKGEENHEKEEVEIISDFKYKNLDKQIIKKKINEEILSGKNQKEIQELKDSMPYELKLTGLTQVITKDELIEELPKYIKATVGLKTVEIPITWNLKNVKEIVEPGIYTLIPEVPDKYKFNDNIQNKNIELTVEYKLNRKQKEVIYNETRDKEAFPKALEDQINIFEIHWKDTPYNDYMNWSVVDNRESNNFKSVELTFSVTNANIETGAIEIRLPRQIFTNRWGDKQGKYEIGLKNTSGGNISYDYRDDMETNEIVIFNTEPILDAVALKVDIDYYDSNLVKNEYPSGIIRNSEHSFKAHLTIKQDGEIVEKDSETLTIKHIISTMMKELNLAKEERIFEWDSKWGEEPLDSNDYFYIKWNAKLVMQIPPHTMPFKITMNNIASHGGKVVDWKGYNSGENIKYEEKNGDLIITSDIPWDSTNTYINTYVVVKYPKKLFENEEIETIKNEVSATLEPYYEEDGPISQPVLKDDTSYVNTNVDFRYPPGIVDIQKSARWENQIQGLIEKISLIDSTESVDLPIFENKGLVADGELTFVGGDKDDFGNYEQREYSVEMVDDLVSVDGKRLTQDDYYFKQVIVEEYNHYTTGIDADEGKVGFTKLDVDEDMRPIEIYCSSDFTGENYQKVATITKTKNKINKYEGDDEYTLEYENGKITKRIKNEVKVDLPNDAVSVKAITTSKKAKVEMHMDVIISLKGSQFLKDAIHDKAQVSIANISTIVVRDDKGNWFNPHNLDTISGNLKEIVKQRDEQIFKDEEGINDKKYGQHDEAFMYAKPVRFLSGTSKYLSNYYGKEDDFYRIPTSIGGYNAFEINGGVLTLEECIELDLLEEQSTAEIYDLLPLGSYIDESTIKAGYYGYHLEGGNGLIPGATVSVEYVNNWRNSGRTMAIFTINIPNDYVNFGFERGFVNETYSERRFYTGLSVDFDLIYPFESVTDYGKTLRNLGAYKSTVGELIWGYPDDANYSSFTAEEKEWFKDLDNDGVLGEGTIENVDYCYDELTLKDPMATQLDFSKKVKSNNDIKYSKSTAVLPDTYYSYQIRFGKTDNSQSKDIVLFDVLENAYKEDEKYWKGTLESVDTTQPEYSKGADPVIYYSTKENIKLSKELTGELKGDADITNTEIWTTQMPEDRSKITAIAVDLRKNKDTPNEEFILNNNQTISIIINMKAPNTDIARYMRENAKAYNDAWISNSYRVATGGVWTKETSQCSRTEVSIRKADIGIDKTSDPSSGTQDDPADVQNNDVLTYDVAVTNKEISNNLSDIVVEDTIPQGLTIDFDNIKYYYNDDKKNAKLVSDLDDEILVERDLATNKQKLIFHIDTLEAKDTIHFLIPTLVDETDEEARYENQAIISGVGGVEYDVKSPITYHEKKVPLADFDFIKKDKQDKLLPNAKFVLYEVDCKDSTHNHDDELIKVDKNGDLVGTSECFKNAKKAASASDGRVHFADLKTNREYRLVEYQAPLDYVTPKGQWIVTYNEGDKQFKISDSIGNPPGFEESGSDLIVRNYKLEELPSTGGRGWTKYMLLGATVMCIGGVWVYQNKKKKIKRL